MRFAVFIVKRLAQAIFVVWASVTLLFAIFFVLPGDRVDQVMGGDRLLDDRTRAVVVENLGLDEPIYIQYGRLWSNLASGDLGVSYVNGDSVADIVHKAAPASFRLAVWAVVLEVLIGVGAALFVASRKGRLPSWIATTVTTVLLSAPIFVLGYLLQYGLGILPFKWNIEASYRPAVQGIGPNHWAGVIPLADQWRYLMLPALTLALVSGAVLFRIAHQSIIGAAQSSYVEAQRIRGVARRRILGVHILRNAISPVIAYVGIDLALLFGSAVITEAVFGWPGVGGEMARALERADAPVIFGLALVIAGVYVVTNFVFELIHRLVDPRIGEAAK